MPSGYDQIVLSDSPIAFWPLDESTGLTAYDISGHGQNATYAGGFTLGAAGIGDGETGATFNGTTGQATATLSSLALPYSLEAWVFCTGNVAGSALKSGAPDGNGNGFGGGNGTYGTAGNDYIVLADNVAWHATSTVITTGTWHHVVLSIPNSNFFTFYVDNVALLSGVAAGFATSTAIYIGGMTYSGSAFYWGGSIAKAAVYNQALTAAQVSKHFNAQYASVLGPSPVRIWTGLQPPALIPPGLQLVGTNLVPAVMASPPGPVAGVPAPVAPQTLTGLQPPATLPPGVRLVGTQLVPAVMKSAPPGPTPSAPVAPQTLTGLQPPATLPPGVRLVGTQLVPAVMPSAVVAIVTTPFVPHNWAGLQPPAALPPGVRLHGIDLVPATMPLTPPGTPMASWTANQALAATLRVDFEGKLSLNVPVVTP